MAEQEPRQELPTQQNQPEAEIQESELQVGLAWVHIRAEVPRGTKLNIQIEAFEDDSPKDTNQSPVVHISQTSKSRPKPLRKLRAYSDKIDTHFRKLPLEQILLISALLLYLITRLISLSNFPIYFFTDEAVQTVLAQDLVDKGMRSPHDELLPTYFYNSYQYNLSTSVYLQVLPYLLFGKQIWATRGISVLISLLAGLCAALTIKNVFKLSNAWGALLFLSITPAWYLHSRTAFETSLGTTFFAVFIYFYLMYRVNDPKNLYWAVIAGALTYYSYSPIRMVVGLMALFLLISDAKYHWQNRKIVFRGLGLTALFALPLLRFQITHPDANLSHLHQLNSYWIQPISIWEKLGLYFSEYLRGLNPAYWFIPNQVDLNRHLMGGYGHLSWISMPFLLIGIWIAIKKFKDPAYRCLLAALLFAPSGAALVGLGITRILSMVVPAALLSGIGISQTIDFLAKKKQRSKPILIGFFFGLLAIFNVYMTWDALTNGPLWFDDYGLGGMQYGAKQIFNEIKEYKEEKPWVEITLSPSWANGTDTIARFFFSDPMPFQMGSIEGYFYEQRELDEEMLFIMIPEEYKKVLESKKFTDIVVEKTLDYPNGQPGFYFTHLRYADNIDQILEEEIAARRILQQAQQRINDIEVTVKYSYLDMGDISNLFDLNDDTLVRTMEANPMEIQILPEETLTIGQIRVRVGGTPTRVDLNLVSTGADETITLNKTVEASPTPRDVIFDLAEPLELTQIHIEVKSIYDEEPAHVHVWEVELTSWEQP